MRKVLALAGVLSLLSLSPVSADSQEPYVVAKGKKSKVIKVETSQRVTGHWQDFGGIPPFQLNGKRALFFAQLHLTCSKSPRYVKIRLARSHADGSLDTTGTNTWVLGKNAPKTFQGSLWWESKTKYPIKAQFKVIGGRCYSSERQFKFWQP